MGWIREREMAGNHGGRERRLWCIAAIIRISVGPAKSGPSLPARLEVKCGRVGSYGAGRLRSKAISKLSLDRQWIPLEGRLDRRRQGGFIELEILLVDVTRVGKGIGVGCVPPLVSEVGDEVEGNCERELKFRLRLCRRAGAIGCDEDRGRPYSSFDSDLPFLGQSPWDSLELMLSGQRSIVNGLRGR